MEQVQETVRLKCTIPVDTNQIDGFWYGKLADAKVSQPIPARKAERYLQVEGFSLFSGSEEDIATVDAEIAKHQKVELPGLAASEDARIYLASMEQANHNMEHELAAKTKRCAVLEEDNIKLRRQLVGLGAQPAAIGDTTSLDEEAVISASAARRARRDSVAAAE